MTKPRYETAWPRATLAVAAAFGLWLVYVGVILLLRYRGAFGVFTTDDWKQTFWVEAFGRVLDFVLYFGVALVVWFMLHFLGRRGPVGAVLLVAAAFFLLPRVIAFLLVGPTYGISPWQILLMPVTHAVSIAVAAAIAAIAWRIAYRTVRVDNPVETFA